MLLYMGRVPKKSKIHVINQKGVGSTNNKNSTRNSGNLIFPVKNLFSVHFHGIY